MPGLISPKSILMTHLLNVILLTHCTTPTWVFSFNTTPFLLDTLVNSMASSDDEPF